MILIRQLVTDHYLITHLIWPFRGGVNVAADHQENLARVSLPDSVPDSLTSGSALGMAPGPTGRQSQRQPQCALGSVPGGSPGSSLGVPLAQPADPQNKGIQGSSV